MRAAAQWLQVVCHIVPGFVVRNVPHVHEGLSLASLYIFAQAMGLLWVFLVSLLAAICTRFITATVVTSSSDGGGAGPLLERPLRAVAIFYLYYSLVRMHVLVGKTLWTCAWEIYHNFPTMRRMLLKSRRNSTKRPEASADSPASDQPSVQETSSASFGGNSIPLRSRLGCRNSSPSLAAHPQSSSPVPLLRNKSSSPPPSPHKTLTTPGLPLRSASPAASPRVPRTKRTPDHNDIRRQIVLTAPLSVLLFLNLVVLIGQLICESDCPELVVFNPIGRFNRNSRFVLFLATMQWVQAWTGLFPTWHVAWSRQTGFFQRFVSGVVIILLVPLSVIRLSMWFFKPAGIGVVHVFAGVRHHLLDSLLVIGWSIWLLAASIWMSTPTGVRYSGFRPAMIRDDANWKHFCSLFKYTLFVWLLLHYLRGCVSLGPAHAQNDLIAITILYPLLLCLIWTVTFTAVVVARYATQNGKALLWTGSCFLLLVISLAFGAWHLCAWVGRGGHPTLVVFVWLHLCRQCFRILRRWTLWGKSLIYGTENDGSDKRQNTCFAVDPSTDKDMKRTYQVERKLGRFAIRLLVLICCSFCAILATCLLMAGLQKRSGLFMSDVVWWRPLPNGVEVTNSGASVMTLTHMNATSASSPVDDDNSWDRVLSREDETNYAVCGHTWRGLQLIDYALLSLIPYMENKNSSQLSQLVATLFPHLEIDISPNAASDERRWLEFDIKSCSSKANRTACDQVTIIAVSGTDPTRLMDYAENLRMWTEPVSLQILSTVFPTVRIWPRGTTEMVIGGIHRILRSMSVSDDQWHYRAILDHVRKIPAEKNVVITGHSLGGGISLVVGALTGRLAVAIQPPGVYHSLAKHQAQQVSLSSLSDLGHSSTAVHKKSVSLILEGDWVQNFDGHGGLVQTMICDQTRTSMAVGCHLLEGAICHLMRHCGDTAQRFKTCHHDYHPTSTGLEVARAVFDLAVDSWSSFLSTRGVLSHWDSVSIASLLVAAILVAKYGAPTYPRKIFNSS